MRIVPLQNVIFVTGHHIFDMIDIYIYFFSIYDLRVISMS